MVQIPDMHPGITERLAAVLADIADVEPRDLSVTLPLFGEGGLMDIFDLDSLDALALSLAVEREFGVDPDAVADPRLRTVGDLVKLIAGGME